MALKLKERIQRDIYGGGRISFSGTFQEMRQQVSGMI